MSGTRRGAWTNWGGNQTATPSRVVAPRSIDDVSAAVLDAVRRGGRIKVVGSGHSFSDIAAPTEVQMTLEHLGGLISADPSSGRVTLGGGTVLADIPAILEPFGLAMENLGDIDRQTIGGAISTGTHGSGARIGGLATQVTAMKLVTGNAEVLSVDGDADPELLRASVIGLGALGVVVEVTLRCVPAFSLRASEHNEPLDAVLSGLRERGLLAEHLDVYWFPHTDNALVKTNERLPAGAPIAPPSSVRAWIDDELLGNGVYGLLCEVGRVAPDLVPAINRLASGAVAQRTYSDLSHRVLVSNRSVRFVEQEYALPAEHLAEAMDHVRALIERRHWKISFPIELRFAAADDVWMSTAHGRDTGYLAVHRYHREPYEDYFAAVEEICVALGGRPHWGKFHTRTADSLRIAYPRFGEFVTLRDRLDSSRVFANPYLDRVLGS